MEKYLRILARIRAGRPVSKEEIRHFIEFSSEVDEAKLGKLKNKLSTTEGFKDATEQDIIDYIEESKKSLTTGAYKDTTLQLAQDAESGRVSQKVAQGLNTLLSGLDIASSLKQISESNKGLKSLQRPTRPTAPGRDPFLQQSLQSAQLGTLDAQKALAPAQLQILDQYMSDINNAKIASTGQAGQFGALAQQAANRRNRASLDLVPFADQFRRDEQRRLDTLVDRRMDETQRIYDNNAQFYGTELQQYNLDANRLGNLGSTGRENLRTSLANFGSHVLPTIVNPIVERKYRAYQDMLPYGEGPAQSAAKASGYINDYIGGYRPNYGPDNDFNQAYLG